MRNIFIVILFSVILLQKAKAQGCVAIRSTGHSCSMEHPDNINGGSGWLFNTNNRYFKSFRHFVGTTEQKQREAEGTEVINHAYTLDLSLTRIRNKRLSTDMDV